MNKSSVKYLHDISFSQLTVAEKTDIKDIWISYFSVIFEHNTKRNLDIHAKTYVVEWQCWKELC
jgi:hypothetical protein